MPSYHIFKILEACLQIHGLCRTMLQLCTVRVLIFTRILEGLRIVQFATRMGCTLSFLKCCIVNSSLSNLAAVGITQFQGRTCGQQKKRALAAAVRHGTHAIASSQNLQLQRIVAGPSLSESGPSLAGGVPEAKIESRSRPAQKSSKIDDLSEFRGRCPRRQNPAQEPPSPEINKN